MKKLIKPLRKQYHFKYKNNYRHAKKLFIFDMALLFLSILLFAATIFFFFWKPGITELVDLDISLGEKRISSGQSVDLAISYHNRSKQTLKGSVLAIQLPRGFMVDRTKTTKNTFSDKSIFPTLNEIKPGQSDTLQISGTLWSTPLQEETITAILTYKASESGRVEQKINRYLVYLPDSLLVGKLKITDKLLAGQKAKFVYTLTNNSTQDLINIRLKHNWPSEIIDAKYSSISLKSKQAIEINGELNLDRAGTYPIEITPEINIGNKYIAQGTNKAFVEVIAPDIISSATFSPKDKYADFAKKLSLDLQWQNKSKFDMQNMQMILKSNYPNIVDWRKTALQNNIRVVGNTVVVDKNTRTVLANPKAGSNDNFTIDLYLKNSYQLNSTENAKLIITPTMQASLPNLPNQIYSQNGTNAQINIATQLTAQSQLRFYTPEGDQIGRLPLPPQVGKTTKYWVYIRLYNSTNRLNNISVKSHLVNGVRFTGRQSISIGNPIKHNNNNISWSHYQIPDNSRTTLAFEVAITPTQAQQGHKLEIMDSVSITATDQLTGKKFDVTTPALDNILGNDDRGKTKGYIVDR